MVGRRSIVGAAEAAVAATTFPLSSSARRSTTLNFLAVTVVANSNATGESSASGGAGTGFCARRRVSLALSVSGLVGEVKVWVVVWWKDCAAFEGTCWYDVAGRAEYGDAAGAVTSVLQAWRSSSSVRGVRGVRGREGTLSSRSSAFTERWVF